MTVQALSLGLNPAWARKDDRASTISCLLYTSDAADERSSVDFGGRRIIKTKKQLEAKESKET